MLKAIHLTSAIISMNSIVWDAALIIISKTTTEVTKIIPRENSLHGLIKTSLYVFLLFSHVKSFWLAVICLLKIFMPKFTCLFEKSTCEKKKFKFKIEVWRNNSWAFLSKVGAPNTTICTALLWNCYLYHALWLIKSIFFNRYFFKYNFCPFYVPHSMRFNNFMIRTTRCQ